MKAATLLILGIMLAGCGSNSKPSAQATPPEPVTLKSGAKMDPVIVSDDAERKSWSADGSPLTWIWASRAERMGVDNTQQPSTQGHKSISIKLRVSSSDAPSVVFYNQAGEIVNGNTWLESDTTGTDSEWLAWCNIPFAHRASTNVRVGVATGPWTVVSRYRQTKGKFEHDSGSPFQFLLFDQLSRKGENPPTSVVLQTTLPDSVMPRAIEFVLRDHAGQELTRAGSATSSKGDVTEYWFRGLRSDVATIEMRSREYEWHTTPDVKLKPGT